MVAFVKLLCCCQGYQYKIGQEFVGQNLNAGHCRSEFQKHLWRPCRKKGLWSLVLPND